jgi:flagellar protein FlaG
MNGNAKVSLGAPISATASSASAGGGFQDRSARDAERSAQYRLVIEEGPSQGTFVYKILDRTTGEVVRQLPREQVVELMRRDNYSSGSVIDTNA